MMQPPFQDRALLIAEIRKGIGDLRRIQSQLDAMITQTEQAISQSRKLLADLDGTPKVCFRNPRERPDCQDLSFGRPISEAPERLFGLRFYRRNSPPRGSGIPIAAFPR